MRGRSREDLELVRALDALAYLSFQRAYRYDPAGFVEECIDWRSSAREERPTDYQLEFLQEVATNDETAIRGPHGLGKTAAFSWLVHWWALTRDGEDWKVPTTASVDRQLRYFLWPEIHKWARRLRWDVIGREPYVDRVELKDMELELSTGQAFAIASNQPTAMEGVHADRVLFLYDEAKSIPKTTYDATSGAFSGGNEDGREAKAVYGSTPGGTDSRFYEICSHKPGFEHIKAMHVTKERVVEAGRMSEDWAEKRRLQWGESSPIYRTRVLGEFATDSDALIPLEWVEAAVERHRAWKRDGKGALVVPRGARRVLGCDIADTGGDDNVIAKRYGVLVSGLDVFGGIDLMETTGRIVQAQQQTQARPVVDVIGIGAGVVARLFELGIDVAPFHAAQSTEFAESSGELRFANKRAAAWWNMRELLDPELGAGLALPDDEMLIADLTTPRYRVQSGGAIVIEPKDGKGMALDGKPWGIRARLGRSTDRGDAVIEAFFLEVLEQEDAPEDSYVVEYAEELEISRY